MKVIFLDFDGVLNSHQSAVFWHHRRSQKSDLIESCPIALSNVEELIRRIPDLKVVITSSWRLGEDLNGLKNLLESSEFIADAIIGSTESFSNTRGDEIEKWLKEHPEVINYAILDDDNDMLDSQKNNFVKVSQLHGFQFGDILWAQRILEKETK